MIRFVYFDLGNVLFFFDHDVAARQMADVAGVPVEKVQEVVYDSGLAIEYERGQISTADFHRVICERTGTTPALADLCLAAADMFTLNLEIVPLLNGLATARQRIGVLSNTCEAHWEFVTGGRYRFIPDLFEVCVTSYQAKSMKPDAEIYRQAIELTGCEPGEIFFTDDKPENVAAAREAGIDAEAFVSVPQLARQLRKRGVPMNY